MPKLVTDSGPALLDPAVLTDPPLTISAPFPTALPDIHVPPQPTVVASAAALVLPLHHIPYPCTRPRCRACVSRVPPCARGARVILGRGLTWILHPVLLSSGMCPHALLLTPSPSARKCLLLLYPSLAHMMVIHPPPPSAVWIPVILPGISLPSVTFPPGAGIIPNTALVVLSSGSPLLAEVRPAVRAVTVYTPPVYPMSVPCLDCPLSNFQ